MPHNPHEQYHIHIHIYEHGKKLFEPEEPFIPGDSATGVGPEEDTAENLKLAARGTFSYAKYLDECGEVRYGYKTSRRQVRDEDSPSGINEVSGLQTYKKIGGSVNL